MAISLFGENFLEGKKFVPNHYRLKQLRNPVDSSDIRYLLSTDHGSWVALDKKEFDQFIRQDVSDDLFKLLEEKGIILTHNNLEVVMKDYKNRYAFLDQGTTLHIILPTLRCNKKCIYCHSAVVKTTQKEYDMDKETGLATLEFIFQTPSPGFTIEFQGGETLLHFEMFQYLVREGKRLARETGKHVNFDLVTNLTLMNDRYLNWIMDEGINLCTSLDGPKEVHDAVRKFEGGAPTYDIIVKNIKKVRAAGKELGLLMVTTKASLGKWKETVDEYVNLGMEIIQLKYLNKLGFAKEHWEEQAYTIEEFIDFWKKAVEYMIELNKKGVKIKERYVQLVLKKILTPYDPGFLDFRSPCGIVTGQMAYNFNGDIYSCDEGRNFDIFKLGNVKNVRYSDVVKKVQSQQLIAHSLNDNLLCDKCAYKPWCGTCLVMNYAEDGNLIPKLPSNSHHILFDMMFTFVFEKLLFNEEDKKVLLGWLKD